MNIVRSPRLQAFYQYRQLSAMWHVSPRTIARWLGELRRTEPDRVVTTYRLVHGFRRDLLIGEETAQLLQDRHVLPPAFLRVLDASARRTRPRP